jgi:uncharacterized protein YjbJ (UPF0337 family)
MNAQTLEGHWTEFKGKLKKRWGSLTNDELDKAEGNVEQLVGVIQRRTGEARESIEHFLQQIYDDVCGEGCADSTMEAAKKYANQAAETIQESTKQVREAVETGYHQTEQIIRERPVESLAVVFGTGLIAGVVMGLLMRSR